MKNSKQIIYVALMVAAIALTSMISSDKAVEDKEIDVIEYSWLAGHWTGDGFGGTSEEMWSEPINGVMMGMYRHHDKDGKLVFYEFITLDKEGMKLKHFNADMSAWETKEEFVHFKPVKMAKDRLEFKGLVFELKSEDSMEITLKLNRNGKVETEIFHMTRVKPKS